MAFCSYCVSIKNVKLVIKIKKKCSYVVIFKFCLILIVLIFNCLIKLVFFQSNCPENLDPIMLTILLDIKLQDINSKTRISIIENFSGYFGLNQVIFPYILEGNTFL